MTECPSPDDLAKLLSEALADTERLHLEDHVGECSHCQEKLQDLAVDSQHWESWERRLQTEKLSWPGLEHPDRDGQEPTTWPTIPGYEILDVLGRGGMGIVYKARQLTLGRLVALKVMRSAREQDPEYRSRFRREAETLARLQHPNIVHIYDFGESEGCLYLALELVAGGSLAQRLRTHTLRPHEAARLLEVLAQTIQVAHDAGILHRDLKPPNILLAEPPSPAGADNQACQSRGEERHGPKVTDFGLARQVEVPGETRTGQAMGTPDYMAPEQARGAAGWSTPAVDIYALGAVLYETLTGRPPFRAESPFETLQLVVTEDPVPPSQLQPRVPRDLETICLKCLRKLPADRYASAADLAEDLRRFQAGEPVLARPISWWTRALKWARRHPLGTALFLVTTLATLILLIVWARFTADLQRLTEDLRTQTGQKEHIQYILEDVQYKKEQIDLLQATSLWRDQFVQLLKEPDLLGPDSEPLRQRLLRQTLKRYAQMVGRFPHRPELAWKRAEAYHWAGTMAQDVGDPEQAAYYLARAVEIGQRISIPPSASPKEAQKLVQFHVDYAQALRTLDEDRKAEARYRQALKLLEPWDPSTDEALLGARAATLTGLASLLLSRGDKGPVEEAEARLHQAQRALEEIPPGADSQPVGGLIAVNIDHHLGILLERKNQPEQAGEVYQRMLHLCQELCAGNPEHPGHQSALANAHGMLSRWYRSRGEEDKARAHLAEALRLQEHLVQHYPQIHHNRYRLSQAYLAQARRARALGQPAEAVRAYRLALEQQHRLVMQIPEWWEYAREQGETVLALSEVANPQSEADLPDLLTRGIRALTRWEKHKQWGAPTRDLRQALLKALTRVQAGQPPTQEEEE
jgi:serine/threonine protein kinase